MKKKIYLLLLLIPLCFTNCKEDESTEPTKTETEDSDGDGVLNKNDKDPENPNICRDLDKDGCDDCSITGADKSGGDTKNDGPDADKDGICDDDDNAPNNPNSCRDTDNDGCDDCSITGADQSGGDPKNDGPDFDNDGICDTSDNEIELAGTHFKDITLNASKTYTLSNACIIAGNATLTIPAGTRITANKSVKSYIAILKGSKIDVQGTAGDPVIMEGQGIAGDWGGLIVCGNAITTYGVDAETGVDNNILYGGTNPNDNSGKINYLIIKHSGANINPEKQFNGLTLYAVGAKTQLNHIAIIDGLDDGIEFFGGSVTANNLYLKNNADDSIDWTEGWNGNLNHALIEFDNGFNYSTIVEGDGDGIVAPFPTLNNLKATAATIGGGIAFQFKNNSDADFTKVSLTGFSTQFKMDGTSTISDIMINGAVANESATYAASTLTDKATDFAWVK